MLGHIIEFNECDESDEPHMYDIDPEVTGLRLKSEHYAEEKVTDV